MRYDIDPEGFTRYGGDCICGAVYTYAGIPEPGSFDPDCPVHWDATSPRRPPGRPTPDTRTDRGRADVSEYRLSPIARLLLGIEEPDEPSFCGLHDAGVLGATCACPPLTPGQPPADHGDGSGAGGLEGGEGV